MAHAEVLAGPPATGARRADLSASRFVGWRNSWKLAFRIGWRELRRARGRSALIMVMVGLPVLVITAGVTWSLGSSTPVQETFGNAQAVVQVDDERSASPSTPVAGPWTAAQVGSLIDGRIIQVTDGEIGLSLGDQLRVAAVGMPVKDLTASGLLRLRSGRWPATDDQIMITKDFAHRHKLSLGAVIPAYSLRPGGTTRTQPTQLHVVGIVAFPEDYGTLASSDAELVTARSQLITPDNPTQVGFLVLRKPPVLLDAVRRLDRSGLQVSSRYLTEHPELGSQQPGSMQGGSEAPIAFYVLAGAGLLFEAMLLAGPAFAISAARQRHTMRLIASNGALRKQLRRQLLGQALLLGVLAGAIGVGLGLLAGRYISTAFAWLTGTWAAPHPPAWIPALVAFLGAALAAVIAALLPARGVGKLDLVAVLRRRTTATRTRTFGPLIGLILMVAGLSVVVGLGFRGAPEDQPRYIMGACTAVSFVGAMLILPWLVSALGKLGARLPLSIRLAGRDLARQLGRSIPAMAAVLVAGGMFAVLAISVASDDLTEAELYTPETTLGQATLSGGGADLQAAVNIIRARHPDWRLTPQTLLGDQVGDQMPSSTVAVVPVGCTPQRAITADAGSKCTDGRSDNRANLVVVPDGQIGSAALPATAEQLLRGGGVVLIDPPFGWTCSPGPCNFGYNKEFVTGNKATLVAGRRKGNAYVPGRPDTVAAMVIRPPDLTRPAPGALDDIWGWISASTAAKAGLPTTVALWNVAAPHGSISVADEKTINELLPPTARLQVERGYQSQLPTAGRALLGIAGALVIIAALISTALSQVEARPDLATLTAIGAPPGLRRRFAAAQSGLVVLVGVVAGQLVGIPAGIAFAASNSRGVNGAGVGHVVVAVPWQLSGELLIGAIAIAAILAVLGAWSSPSLTRRLN